MKTEVRTINKELATEMLKRNSQNRKLTNNHVTFLARQMKENKWYFDGQPIRFDIQGRLLDGQHRLNAVIESNTSHKFLIIRDLEPDSFQVMDTGRLRSAADTLSTLGIHYASDIASVVKTLKSFEKGSSFDRARIITNTDVVNWYEKNQDIDVLIRRSEFLSNQFSRVLSRSQITALMYFFNKLNVEHSKTFLNKLCTGLDLKMDSPIYLLRKKLVENKMSKLKLSTVHKYALIIKAWNYFRLNKKVTVIRWNNSVESFPNAI